VPAVGALGAVQAHASTNTTISDEASCIAAGGEWDASDCAITTPYSVALGDTLTLDGSISLSFQNGLTLDGTIDAINGGDVRTKGVSTIDGKLSIDSLSDFDNRAPVTIDSTGTIDLSGTLFVTDTITNNGTITIECGGTITPNGGTITGNTPQNADCIPPQAAPSVSPLPNSNGWWNSNVTVDWNWTDSGGSGIDPSDCDTASTYSGPGSIHLMASCSDVADNVGSADYFLSVDETPPSLAPSVSPNPVLLHGAATAEANATDSLSGVDSSSCDTANTSAPGPQTVSCSATDLAGNTANASASYVVGFNVIHIAPATPAPFLAGSSIPVKFQLAGAGNTAISNAVAALLPACAATVTYPGRTRTCATFNKSDHYFHATVTTPTTAKDGVPVTLAIHVTDESTQVASASLAVEPVPALQVHDVAMKPAGNGVFEMPVTITLSAPSTQAVHFSWATTPGSAHSPADYIGAAGTATIAAGHTSVVVYVKVRVKTAPVINKTFRVFVANVQGAIAARLTGTVIIIGHH
jgi:hypothetical protein